MFQSIANWLSEIFSWFGRVLGWLGHIVQNIGLAIWAAIVAVVTLCTDALVWVGALMIWLLEKMVDLLGLVEGVATSGGVPGAQYFALANTVLPLTEITGMVTVWAGAWLIALLIRVAKSFVPTVS